MKAIELFRWEEMNTHVLAAIRETHVEKANHCADLAMALQKSTLENAARAAFAVSEAITSLVISKTLVRSSAPAVINMTFQIAHFVEFRKRILAKCFELPCEGIASAIELVHSASYQRQPGDGEGVADSFDSLVKAYISKAFMPTRPTHPPRRLQENDAGTVMSIILSSELATERLIESFTEALLANGRDDQIRDLLRTPDIAEDVNNGHICRIAHSPAAQIDYAVPVFSHRQPEADIAGHPSVTSFLRGDEKI